MLDFIDVVKITVADRRARSATAFRELTGGLSILGGCRAGSAHPSPALRVASHRQLAECPPPFRSRTLLSLERDSLPRRSARIVGLGVLQPIVVEKAQRDLMGPATVEAKVVRTVELECAVTRALQYKR